MKVERKVKVKCPHCKKFHKIVKMSLKINIDKMTIKKIKIHTNVIADQIAKILYLLEQGVENE
jgi:hypothetical protein